MVQFHAYNAEYISSFDSLLGYTNHEKKTLLSLSQPKFM